MQREEIIEGVIELLQGHKSGIYGSPNQDPYKSDFFRLFAAAFNAGFLSRIGQSDTLSADALRDIIESREPEFLDTEAWDNLRAFWSEWTYAWRHIDEYKK